MLNHLLIEQASSCIDPLNRIQNIPHLNNLPLIFRPLPPRFDRFSNQVPNNVRLAQCSTTQHAQQRRHLGLPVGIPAEVGWLHALGEEEGKRHFPVIRDFVPRGGPRVLLRHLRWRRIDDGLDERLDVRVCVEYAKRVARCGFAGAEQNNVVAPFGFGHVLNVSVVGIESKSSKEELLTFHSLDPATASFNSPPAHKTKNRIRRNDQHLPSVYLRFEVLDLRPRIGMVHDYDIDT
jgi:hypothetical protein